MYSLIVADLFYSGALPAKGEKMSFVITYEERLARLAATKIALQQTDGQTFQHLVPSVYELIMAEGLGNVRSQVFDLIIDFIHRAMEEGTGRYGNQEISRIFCMR
jgi:hypothetical protein